MLGEAADRAALAGAVAALEDDDDALAFLASPGASFCSSICSGSISRS
jgi:hypothetical protein